jgi:hypothetical protein
VEAYQTDHCRIIKFIEIPEDSCEDNDEEKLIDNFKLKVPQEICEEDEVEKPT